MLGSFTYLLFLFSPADLVKIVCLEEATVSNEKRLKYIALHNFWDKKNPTERQIKQEKLTLDFLTQEQEQPEALYVSQ